jgi:ribosome-associated protein
LSAAEILEKAIAVLIEMKAEDLVALDLRELSPVADYFLIASGNSEQHVVAIARNVERELAKLGTKAWHREGTEGRRWVLLDYVDTVVHVFHRETRAYYRLESLWGDAKRLPTGSPAAASRTRGSA